MGGAAVRTAASAAGDAFASAASSVFQQQEPAVMYTDQRAIGWSMAGRPIMDELIFVKCDGRRCRAEVSISVCTTAAARVLERLHP